MRTQRIFTGSWRGNITRLVPGAFRHKAGLLPEGTKHRYEYQRRKISYPYGTLSERHHRKIGHGMEFIFTYLRTDLSANRFSDRSARIANIKNRFSYGSKLQPSKDSLLYRQYVAAPSRIMLVRVIAVGLPKWCPAGITISACLVVRKLWSVTEYTMSEISHLRLPLIVVHGILKRGKKVATRPPDYLRSIACRKRYLYAAVLPQADAGYCRRLPQRRIIVAAGNRNRRHSACNKSVRVWRWPVTLEIVQKRFPYRQIRRQHVVAGICRKIMDIETKTAASPLKTPILTSPSASNTVDIQKFSPYWRWLPVAHQKVGRIRFRNTEEFDYSGEELQVLPPSEGTSWNSLKGVLQRFSTGYFQTVWSINLWFQGTRTSLALKCNFIREVCCDMEKYQCYLFETRTLYCNWNVALLLEAVTEPENFGFRK